jgi:hypothetical protein
VLSQETLQTDATYIGGCAGLIRKRYFKKPGRKQAGFTNPEKCHEATQYGGASAAKPQNNLTRRNYMLITYNFT